MESGEAILNRQIDAPVAFTGFAKRITAEGIADEAVVRRAQRLAGEAGKPLITFMVEHQLADSQRLCLAAAREFGLAVLDLDAFDKRDEVINLIDERLIVEHQALPLLRRGNKLFVAIADPGNLAAVDQFQFHSGLQCQPVLVEHHQLSRHIDDYLDSHAQQLLAIGDSELDKLEIAGLEEEVEQGDEQEINDAPLVRYVNKILIEAIQQGASDIHFEPYENRYRIRFRMDGLLSEFAAPAANLAGRIAARLKVMARLDISERRLPQDGRIKLKLSRSRSIDFRVSTCPTLFGEKVVLRLLNAGGLKLGIDVLGYSPEQRQLFMDAIHRPHGMVLVTGPTGSGKTVSLYSALNILNTGDRNISAVEDPSEIYLKGINQVNVHPKIGLTFAAALRTFLRQDPDVIMIGEIRDSETAEIAIKAAQTGHMVLSTLHTNDAPQSITRLMNMGVEPYNIVSAVSLVIAQRLARRLCPHCKTPHELSEEALLALGFQPEQIGTFTPFRAVGCERCHSGYRDRIGIFQVMPISETMERIILQGGNAFALAEQAAHENIPDLRQAGLEHVMAGITSIEEVERVTAE